MKQKASKRNPNIQISLDTNLAQNEQVKQIFRNVVEPKSSKNSHQLKKFNFNQIRPQISSDKVVKQDKINKLQRQNMQLKNSLEILKNGAVSAIIEKDEIIHRMHRHFHSIPTKDTTEDNIGPSAQQIQSMFQYISDLEKQRSTLIEESDAIRRKYEIQIEERQQIIDELTHQLNWSNERIDNLEKYDKLLEDKIRVMEQSNQNLSVMLNQSQQCLRDERKEKKRYSEENQLLKNKSTSSIVHGSDSENGSTSWAPASILKFFNHSDASNKEQSIDDTEMSKSKSIKIRDMKSTSQVEQLKHQHQTQIQDLTYYYENRLERLMGICRQYLQADNPTSQKPAVSKESMAADVTDFRSNYSNFTCQRDDQKKLNRITSLGSFKSGYNKMDPIDEKEQMEIPRRTLKRELDSFYNAQKGDQKSVSSSSNLQKESQLSYKYPNSSFRKSKQALGQQKYEQKSIKRQSSCTISKVVNDSSLIEEAKIPTVCHIEVQDIKQENAKVTQFWNKLFWFASGTLTGGLILKFGNKMFK